VSAVDEKPLVIACGSERLIGILTQPSQSAARVGVLVVVGGPQYRVGSHRQFVLTARHLAAHGYPVLRFDYRGMGDSDGEPRGFERVDEDIRAALDAFAAADPRLGGFVLWGLCDAASACLMYCAGDARVQGVIIANPWVRTDAGEARSYLSHYYLQRLLQRSFWRKLLSGEFRAGKSLGELSQVVRQSRTASGEGSGPGFIARMRAGLQKFAGPVLCLLSERDLTAKQFQSLCADDRQWRRLMSRAAVTRIDLPDTDHTFSSAQSLARVLDECAAWLGRVARHEGAS
jgi:exosortase A-associated hydrolase 1